MSNKAQRKKCVDCKRCWNGTPGRLQWCDDCGGELRPIPYNNRKKARTRRG